MMTALESRNKFSLDEILDIGHQAKDFFKYKNEIFSGEHYRGYYRGIAIEVTADSGWDWGKYESYTISASYQDVSLGQYSYFRKREDGKIKRRGSRKVKTFYERFIEARLWEKAKVSKQEHIDDVIEKARKRLKLLFSE